MVNNQLLTKTVNFAGITEIGQGEETRTIKFNLPRGMVARILGFSAAWILTSEELNETHSLEIYRSAVKAPSVVRPPANALWINRTVGRTATQSMNLPKPYRCVSLSVRVWSIDTTSASVDLIIYYDVDDISKDEDVHILESTKQRGTRAP